MRAALSKWGNSLAVRIPRAVAESVHLRDGEKVDVEALRDGEIRIRRRKSLAELVKAITPENRHQATAWGPPAGKEIW